MTVKELITALETIKVPAEVFFPNMEIRALHPINKVNLHDKGDYTWIKPEYRYEVILS